MFVFSIFTFLNGENECINAKLSV